VTTQRAFADDLLSVVLLGSAAERRLRQTSDVNVLRRVDPDVSALEGADRIGLVMAAASFVRRASKIAPSAVLRCPRA
jgi:hypothetical protein